MTDTLKQIDRDLERDYEKAKQDNIRLEWVELILKDREKLLIGVG